MERRSNVVPAECYQVFKLSLSFFARAADNAEAV